MIATTMDAKINPEAKITRLEWVLSAVMVALVLFMAFGPMEFGTMSEGEPNSSLSYDSTID